jgi:hypothetical protein
MWETDRWRYERAAVRWLEGFIEERRPTLSEIALANGALVEIGGAGDRACATFFGQASLGGFDPSVDELPRERRACDRSHDCEHHVRPKLPIEARTIGWVPHDHLRNEEADQEAEDRPDYSAENYHVGRRVSP